MKSSPCLQDSIGRRTPGQGTQKIHDVGVVDAVFSRPTYEGKAFIFPKIIVLHILKSKLMQH